MQKLLVVAICILCFFKSLIITAQAEDSIPGIKPNPKKPILCEIKMHDGSSYKGYIEKQSDTLIYLKSSAGVLIHVPKKQVSSIDFINGHTTQDSTGNLTIHIPSISNYYYVGSSNALLMKKGEVYGSSSYFLFYNVNYAFNQHFSLGVSSSFLAAPILLHAKLNFEVAKKLYLGIDAMGGSGSWISAKTYGGGGLIKLTYGEAKKNFTFFGGYGDIDYYTMARRRGGRRGGFRSGTPAHYTDYNSAIAGAAFTHPISHKLSFAAEIFAAPQVKIYTIAPAIRTTIRPNISWVLGIEAFLNTTSNVSIPFIGIPYIGFSFRL